MMEEPGLSVGRMGAAALRNSAPAWVAANAWGSKHGGMVYALDVRGQVIKAAEWAHPDGEGDHFVKRDLEPSLIAL
jgi:hypothetical protein